MQRTINGRYKLRGEIGSGGMGIVHKAIDRLTGDEVAFKQVHLNSDLSYSDSTTPDATLEALRMLHAKEFQILAGIAHTYLVLGEEAYFFEGKEYEQALYFAKKSLDQS